MAFLFCQDVVIGGAGRFSRSAKFATSSELLYLLNLLYNMPGECCDEYKLIQLYQKSSVWCFAFSHASTFEFIPAVTNGSTRSHGNNTPLSKRLINAYYQEQLCRHHHLVDDIQQKVKKKVKNPHKKCCHQSCSFDLIARLLVG